MNETAERPKVVIKVKLAILRREIRENINHMNDDDDVCRMSGRELWNEKKS